MEGSPGDLQTKYHKIAAEYSKLRAQVAVLKKAVIDEQTSNAELKESLREAEQRLRKTDQEADSLNFRNEQLTRRVTVLQNELDVIQNQSKNKKTKGKSHEAQQASELANHVIDEEFRKKIQENAKLLSLINEKDEQHRQELGNLTSQLDKVLFELAQLRKSSTENEEKSRTEAMRLEREMSCMREGQRQLSSVSQELSQLRKTHMDYKTLMEAKVARLKGVISSHLPFIDSRNEALASLNVPRMVNNRGSLTSKEGDELRASLQQLAASLALWHKVTESRLYKLPNADSAVNSKYSSSVREMSELALELVHSLSPSKMCDTVAQKLPAQLATYCAHLQTLLLTQRLGTEDEPADERLKESNQGYLDSCEQLVSHMTQISSSVTMYKSMQHSAEAQQKHQRGLITLTSSLQGRFKDVFNAFVLKSGVEAEMSWASEELISANQALINSLSSLIESSTKVAECLNELWKSANTTPLPHPLVADYRRRGVHYLHSIQTDEALSIPYLQALKDHEEAQNSGEMRKALLQQLEGGRQQLVAAEQERESLRQDLHLLQLRLDQDRGDAGKDEETYLQSSSVTSMLGLLEAPFKLSDEVEAREEKIKLYFRRRIYELITENSELQSKSATLLAECLGVVRRLEASMAGAVRLEKGLQQAREREAQLQEEVTTTATNYEAQLTTMSEHLATMNDKLAQQKDTIDQLQYQIDNKKKGKK